jgi:hypothetical protein
MTAKSYGKHNTRLAAQVQAGRPASWLAGNLPEWISGGPGRTVLMNSMNDVAATTHAVIEPMIEAAHRKTVGKRVAPYWKGASAIRRAP